MTAWTAQDDTGRTVSLVTPDPMPSEPAANWFAEVAIGPLVAVAVTRDDITRLRDACDRLLAEPGKEGAA